MAYLIKGAGCYGASHPADVCHILAEIEVKWYCDSIEEIVIVYVRI